MRRWLSPFIASIVVFAILLISPNSCRAQEDVKAEEKNATDSVKKARKLTGIPQIDYKQDPNLPRELAGFDLSNYPFYNSLPEDVQKFTCDGRFDGFYASIPHGCQVYHNCLFGVRYSFMCANYTLFDQVNLICNFANGVQCHKSHLLYDENEKLYKEPTTTTTERILPRRKSRPRRPELDKYKFQGFRRGNRPTSQARTTTTTEEPEQYNYDYDYYYDTKPEKLPQQNESPSDYDYYYYSEPEPPKPVTPKPLTRKPVRRRPPVRPIRRRLSPILEEPVRNRQNVQAPADGNRIRVKGKRKKIKKTTTTTTTTTTTLPPNEEEYDYYYEYYYLDDTTTTSTTTTTTSTTTPKPRARRPGKFRKRRPVGRRAKPVEEERPSSPVEEFEKPFESSRRKEVKFQRRSDIVQERSNNNKPAQIERNSENNRPFLTERRSQLIQERRQGSSSGRLSQIERPIIEQTPDTEVDYEYEEVIPRRGRPIRSGPFRRPAKRQTQR